ncbi:MAG: flagellar hook-associated protein FlgL [Sphingomonadales bacterium]|nr:flagellar hook-associated protein FlgL [Sphingomonadales bacterium]
MTTISTSGFYDSAIFSMKSLRSQANDLQAQISTGNRLKTSADDPVAAARMRMLTRSDALSKIDDANATAAKSDLTLADDTLTNISTIVTRIRELATQAANGTLTDADRKGIGAEVTGLRQNLVALANTSDSRGQSLFGGNGTNQAYTLDSAGNATYTGSATSDTIGLGAGLTVTRGITGPEFMNSGSGASATDLLTVVKTLGDALQGNGPAGTTPQQAAQAALTPLDNSLTSLTTAQTIVGSRLSWIDTTTSIRDQMTQQRTDDESTVGGTDVAEAVSRLQQVSTILQASQASFVKLAGLSLFSMIS